MQIDLIEILQRLEAIRDKIHGCGNGRNEVEKFIKELKKEYGITDSN